MVAPPIMPAVMTAPVRADRLIRGRWSSAGETAGRVAPGEGVADDMATVRHNARRRRSRKNRDAAKPRGARNASSRRRRRRARSHAARSACAPMLPPPPPLCGRTKLAEAVSLASPTPAAMAAAAAAATNFLIMSVLLAGCWRRSGAGRGQKVPDNRSITRLVGQREPGMFDGLSASCHVCASKARKDDARTTRVNAGIGTNGCRWPTFVFNSSSSAARTTRGNLFARRSLARQR